MGKTIKLEESVYFELDEIRVKGETFSQAVARLLDLRRMLSQLDPILRGQQAYQGWKSASERENKTAD